MLLAIGSASRRSGLLSAPSGRYTDPLAMPKMKTHSGAKKRFKRTANGKVRARHAFTSHILEKKSPKRKRHSATPLMLKDADAKRVNKLLGRQASDPRQALRPRQEEAPRDARADEGLPRRGELELQAREGSA